MKHSDGRCLRGIVAVVTVLAGLAGRAAADDLAPAIAGAADGGARGPDRWQVALGTRSSLFRGAAYDPFSNRDAFWQVSLAALVAFPGGRAGAGGNRLVPAVGLIFEDGGTAATARGTTARLSLTRIAAALEQRLVSGRHLYLMARVAPGALRVSADLDDPSAPAALTTSYWALCLDASAGVGVRLIPPATSLAFGLVGEGGYGYAPAHALDLAPALPSADRSKAGVTSLGSLALRGAFVRVALTLSY
jgi:hypothetical protein